MTDHRGKLPDEMYDLVFVTATEQAPCAVCKWPTFYIEPNFECSLCSFLCLDFYWAAYELGLDP